MTDEGRKYAIARLSDAPNIEALRRVWESLGADYKRCPIVAAHKDTLKASMEADHAQRSTP